MKIGRVTKVVNPKRIARARPRAKPKAKHRKRVSSSNPAHMLTLGWVNPAKRRNTVAKTAKKRRVAARRRPRAMNASRRRPSHRRRSNPGTRVVVVAPRRNKGGHRRARKNPHFFGSNVNVVKLAEYVVGGLVGVTVNRIGLTMLPSTLTSGNFGAGIAALALAGAEWWV